MTELGMTVGLTLGATHRFTNNRCATHRFTNAGMHRFMYLVFKLQKVERCRLELSCISTEFNQLGSQLSFLISRN